MDTPASMPIPTTDDLATRLGFRPPGELARLVQLAHELDPKGGYDGLGIINLLYFDAHLGKDSRPDHWSSYGDQPVECFDIASSGTAGWVPVMIADDPDSGSNDFFFGMFSADEKTTIFGHSLLEGLANYIAMIHDGISSFSQQQQEQFLLVVRAVVRELDLSIPEIFNSQNANNIISERLSRSDIFPTADGLGALVPAGTVDHSFLDHWVSRMSESRGYGQQLIDLNIEIETAYERLRVGELGTALVMARNLYHSYWAIEIDQSDVPTKIFASLLEEVYLKLGRPLLARRVRARMKWVLETLRQ